MDSDLSPEAFYFTEKILNVLKGILLVLQCYRLKGHFPLWYTEYNEFLQPQFLLSTLQATTAPDCIFFLAIKIKGFLLGL